MTEIVETADMDSPTPQTKEIQIPANATIVVVNHWDWPFAWIMCGVFVVAFFAFWAVGRKKL